MSASPPTRHELTEFEPGECYPIALPEEFIRHYTAPGDLVFDPFSGSGTTLLAAERLGRRGLGLEIHPERVEWAARLLRQPDWVRQGDALRIGELDLPTVDLVVTSPPYMTRLRHPENPLTGYQTEDADYGRYLGELAAVFGAAWRLLAPGGRMVINVATLDLDGHVTTLAWDLAAAMVGVADFEREIVIDWREPPEWLTMDYCLIFAKPA
jgi:DNA modification methylase